MLAHFLADANDTPPWQLSRPKAVVHRIHSCLDLDRYHRCRGASVHWRFRPDLSIFLIPSHRGKVKVITGFRLGIWALKRCWIYLPCQKNLLVHRLCLRGCVQGSRCLDRYLARMVFRIRNLKQDCGCSWVLRNLNGRSRLVCSHGHTTLFPANGCRNPTGSQRSKDLLRTYFGIEQIVI